MTAHSYGNMSGSCTIRITMIRWVIYKPYQIKRQQLLSLSYSHEFVAKVITELMRLWKGCKIVHGSPHHKQSQGSVERANVDVKSLVMQWMVDENITSWSWGMQFIAHIKWYHMKEYSKLLTFCATDSHVGLTLVKCIFLQPYSKMLKWKMWVQKKRRMMARGMMK